MYLRLFYLLMSLLFSGNAFSQKDVRNFIYLDKINISDLQGRKIIELIETQIITTLKSKDGQEMPVDENNGYLVTYKTVKGMDLGINGILIEDRKTGELQFYEIGTKEGLKFEKIRNNMIYLKSKELGGAEKRYDMYLTCRLIE